MKGDNVFKKLKGIIFRFWLLNVNRSRLKHYLITRKEKRKSCEGCGECCERSGCEAFDKEKRNCKIWRTYDTLLQCRDFPFHPKQVKRLKNCRYYWKGK